MSVVYFEQEKEFECPCGCGKKLVLATQKDEDFNRT